MSLTIEISFIPDIRYSILEKSIIECGGSIDLGTNNIASIVERDAYITIDEIGDYFDTFSSLEIRISENKFSEEILRKFILTINSYVNVKCQFLFSAYFDFSSFSQIEKQFCTNKEIAKEKFFLSDTFDIFFSNQNSFSKCLKSMEKVDDLLYDGKLILYKDISIELNIHTKHNDFIVSINVGYDLKDEEEYQLLDIFKILSNESKQISGCFNFLIFDVHDFKMKHYDIVS